MMYSTTPAEPITSDPVIINSKDAETSTLGDTVEAPGEVESVEARLLKLEEYMLPRKISPPSRSPSPTRRRRVFSRERSIIRPRYRSPAPPEDLPIVSNTTSLLTVLADSSTPDKLVEVQSGPGRCNSHLIYLTTLPIYQPELEKISWIFRGGLEDAWVQKPEGGLRFDPSSGAGRRGRVDYYDDFDDRRLDRNVTSVVKLGRIFTTIFSSEVVEEQLARVKFVTVIQGKGSGWAKLITSYSKRRALVDLFHELVNGYSVLFVGAVLLDVEMPVEGRIRRGRPEVVFKKVGSVKEAEEVDEGTIGIIC